MQRKLQTKIKVRYLVVAAMLTLLTGFLPKQNISAKSCPDVKIIFARGSGAEKDTNDSYLDFKSTIESKLSTISLAYEFEDLDYPAIGIDDMSVLLGAYFGAGEAYEFGDSVNTGVDKLTSEINNSSCTNTKYVIAGYSQGAMVVSKSLGSLNSDKIIYAATFGDPKIYLPEGGGIFPAACRNENLSDYRMYVPDCQAYKGLLGAYVPYEPSEYTGKVGTWCNKKDLFCSSHFSISDHTSYVSDKLYEDASRVIFDKITDYFGIENHISSPHDTAFLIDSTGSMSSMIEKYKAEALRLATQTLESGGRVALYDYRDLSDPYEPVERCNFETCTLDTFTNGLSGIKANNGGDTPESLLSASLHVMNTLNWKYGSTKSLVVLTDANYLSPDRDGVKFEDVVKLSKKIDPVNFYIITNSRFAFYYDSLAEATDGKVVTNFDELNLLTDYIMERYDSLPRVEESEEMEDRPFIEYAGVQQISQSEVKINLVTSGTKTIVILNDLVLGITEETEFTIHGLDSSVQNMLTLVPVLNDTKGEALEINLELDSGYRENNKIPSTGNNEDEIILENAGPVIPKTPNTGKK